MKSNKLMLFFAALSLSVGVLVSCEDDSATENQVNSDFVGLMELSHPIDIPEGETATIQGKVFASEAKDFDRVVTIKVIRDEDTYNETEFTVIDPADYSVPATATIPAGSKEGTFQMTVTENDLGYDGKLLVLSILPSPGIEVKSSSTGTVSGGNFEHVYDRIAIPVRRLCTETKLRVQIVTDNYGSETTWELYDAAGTLVASGGPYADSTPELQESVLLCLPSGDYTFVAYDLYGDGMNDGTNEGYYKLIRYDDEGTDFVVAQNGTFLSDDVVPFTLP